MLPNLVHTLIVAMNIATFPFTQTEEISIPIHFSQFSDKHPYIVVTLNSIKKFALIVDTGAGNLIYINPKYRSLAIEHRNPIFESTTLPDIYFPGKPRGLHIRNSEATILQTSTFSSKFMDLPVLGIMGIGVFGPKTVKFEWPKMRMKIAPKFTHKADMKGEFDLDYTVSNGPLILCTSPDRSYSKRFLLDTGSPMSMVRKSELSKFHAKPLNIRRNMLNSIGQMVDMNIYNCSGIILGSYFVRQFQPAEPGIDQDYNIIGMDILIHFNLLFDQVAKRVHFTPIDNQSSWNSTNGDTINFVKKGKAIFISSVDTFSPAYWAGVRRMDEIVSINDIKLSSLDSWETEQLINPWMNVTSTLYLKDTSGKFKWVQIKRRPKKSD